MICIKNLCMHWPSSLKLTCFFCCVSYLYVLPSSVYSTLLINFIFFRQKMLAKMWPHSGFWPQNEVCNIPQVMRLLLQFSPETLANLSRVKMWKWVTFQFRDASVDLIQIWRQLSPRELRRKRKTLILDSCSISIHYTWTGVYLIKTPNEHVEIKVSAALCMVFSLEPARCILYGN